MSPLLFAVVDAVLLERYMRALSMWQHIGNGAPVNQRKSLRVRATARAKKLGWWRSTWQP